MRCPVRLRGYSRRFHPTDRTNLTLQLRALFGINARCEIILYLLTHDAAHPSQIARDAYYFQRTVQSTLVEMMASGVVNFRGVRREKHYWIRPEHWAVLLNRKEPLPRWITCAACLDYRGRRPQPKKQKEIAAGSFLRKSKEVIDKGSISKQISRTKSNAPTYRRGSKPSGVPNVHRLWRVIGASAIWTITFFPRILAARVMVSRETAVF